MAEELLFHLQAFHVYAGVYAGFVRFVSGGQLVLCPPSDAQQRVDEGVRPVLRAEAAAAVGAGRQRREALLSVVDADSVFPDSERSAASVFDFDRIRHASELRSAGGLKNRAVRSVSVGRPVFCQCAAKQFIFEIRSEWGFVAVAIALSVFLACFALYDFLDEVWALSKRKRDSLCRD